MIFTWNPKCIEFRKIVLEMYKQKTILKGGDSYLYNKYKNMINANFNKLGVGMSNMQMGYGIYWTQLFTD